MANTRYINSGNAQIVRIDHSNLYIYINLAQSYEAEFSDLTHKKTNCAGIVTPDTIPNAPFIGYLIYHERLPAGFCVIEINENYNDVAEFYISPHARKQRLGFNFAFTVFDLHPGTWHVRQIQGADRAKAFWRRVIGEYTNQQFSETQVKDDHWGEVTRQKFLSRLKTISTYSRLTSKDAFERYGLFPSYEKNSSCPTHLETKFHHRRNSLG